MKKSTVLLVGGAGYVLGARAGRERYEQIKSAALKVRNDPRVRSTAHQAADGVREKAPHVTDRIKQAAAATAEKVRPANDVGDGLNPDSTHFQEHPFPQGQLS